MPLFSIIIPVYKAEAYLARCIDSVLAQTLPDWELLLVEDGSPDGCGAICDQYARQDERIHVIHQPNQGVSAARNVGVARSRGDLLLFLDSDDRISPITLQVMHHVQQLYPQDVVCWKHTFDPGTICTAEPESLPFTQRSLSQLGTLWAVECSICLVTNKLFDGPLIRRTGLRFREDLGYMEDGTFALDYCRLLRKNLPELRLVRLELPLYCVERGNENSITSTQSDRYLARQLETGPIVLQAADAFGCQGRELDLVYTHYLNCVAFGVSCTGSRKEARRYFRDPRMKQLLLYFSSTHFYSPLYVPMHLHSRALVRRWLHLRDQQPQRYGTLDWGIYKLFYFKWHRL